MSSGAVKGTAARSALALVLVLAAAAFAAPAAYAGAYQFKDLTSCCTLAGSNPAQTYFGAYIAAAVNDNGDVVGTGVGADGHSHGYILKNDQFTLLDYLPPQNGGDYSNHNAF